MKLRPKDIRLLIDIYLDVFTTNGLRENMEAIEGNYDYSVEKLAELGLVEFKKEIPFVTILGMAQVGKLSSI